MASPSSSSPRLALFFLLNLLFFALVTATCECPCPPKSKPPHQPKPKPLPKPKPNPNPNPNPNPAPCPPPSTGYEHCPRDALKIGVCAKLLDNDLLKIVLGKPPVSPCCNLIKGLADFEAALCLCTALKASVLGIDLEKLPVSLELLINNCGGKVPPGFKCA